MKKSYIIIIVVVLLLIIGYAMYNTMQTPPMPAQTMSPTMAPKTVLPSYVYTNKDSKASISVVYDTTNNTAVMTGVGYTDLVFKQAMSADGARYTNDEKGLELWNTGNDITLRQGDTLLFTGSTPL